MNGDMFKDIKINRIPESFSAGIVSSVPAYRGEGSTHFCEFCLMDLKHTIVTVYFKSLPATIYANHQCGKSNFREKPRVIQYVLKDCVDDHGDILSDDLYKAETCCECAKKLNVRLYKDRKEVEKVMENWVGSSVLIVMDDCITVNTKDKNYSPSCGVCGHRRYISIIARTKGVPLALYKRWLTCDSGRPILTYSDLNSTIIHICMDCALASGLPILKWCGPDKEYGEPVYEAELLEVLRERLCL